MCNVPDEALASGIAARKQSKSIPMDSKVAYLDSEVLSIATPPVVFMEKCENELGVLLLLKHIIPQLL
jgi:hypothetical protein